ncbi:MAG: type II toxin-antitoxin system BrnA family antitoxin [Solidesulfovibrio sp. DCME]|uniref:type II toxin-antitoxin system BrnA family antitoxin n=1 Tax=Solidesulfovibrio sp. DCME TaxID=3447380 RepID=UPI003D0D1036
MKAKEFDAAFDSGEDVLAHLDLDGAVRRNQQVRRVNVDFPLWMVQELDRRARRLGLTRQSLLKVYIAASLKDQGETTLPPL